MSDRGSDVGSQGSSGEESWTFVTDTGKCEGDSSSSSAASDFVRVQDDTSGGVSFHRGSPRERGTEMAEYNCARSRQFTPGKNEDVPVTVLEFAETPGPVSLETSASSNGADDKAPLQADDEERLMPTSVADETPAQAAEELMAAEGVEEGGGFEVLSQPVATSESPSRSRSSSSSSSIVRVSDVGGEEEGEGLLRELVLMAETSGGPASYSFIRRPGIPEDGPIPEGVDDRCESDLLPGDDTEDLSEAVNGLGNIDLTDLHLDNRSRLYTHTPNNWLNTLLTFSATLMLALGLGIGIGHCIGSTREQNMWAEVNAHQSLRLQALERELSTSREQIRHAQTHQERLGEANTVLTSSVRETQQQLTTASVRAQHALQCQAAVDALERRLDRLGDRYEASLSNAFSKYAHVQAAYETCSHQLGFLRPNPDGKPAAHPGISASSGSNPTKEPGPLSLDSTGVNTDGSREVEQCTDCYEIPASPVTDLEIPDMDSSKQEQKIPDSGSSIREKGIPDVGSSVRKPTVPAESSDEGVMGQERDDVKGDEEGTDGVMKGTPGAMEKTGGQLEDKDRVTEGSDREMTTDGVTKGVRKVMVVSDEATGETEGEMTATDRTMEGTAGAPEDDGVTVEVEEQSGGGIPHVTREKVGTRNAGLKFQEEKEERRGGKVVDKAKGREGDSERESAKDKMTRRKERDEKFAKSRTEESKTGSRKSTKESDKEKDGKGGEGNKEKREGERRGKVDGEKDKEKKDGEKKKGENGVNEKKEKWEGQRKKETKNDKTGEKIKRERESEKKITKKEKKERRRSDKKEDKYEEKYKRKAKRAEEEAMKLEKELRDLKYRMERVSEDNSRLEEKLVRQRLKGNRKSGDAIKEVIGDVISTVSHVTKDLGKTCGHLAKDVKAALEDRLFGESRQPEREKRDDTSDYAHFREPKPDPPGPMGKVKDAFFAAQRAVKAHAPRAVGHVIDTVTSTLGRVVHESECGVRAVFSHLVGFGGRDHDRGRKTMAEQTAAFENPRPEENVQAEKKVETEEKATVTHDNAKAEYVKKVGGKLEEMKSKISSTEEHGYAHKDAENFEEDLMKFVFRYWGVLGGRKQGDWVVCQLKFFRSERGGIREVCAEHLYPWQMEVIVQQERHEGVKNETVVEEKHVHGGADDDDDDDEEEEEENWFLRRGRFYHSTQKDGENWFLRRGKFYHPREATPASWYLRRGSQRETERKKRTEDTGEDSLGERSRDVRTHGSDGFKDWTQWELDTYWRWEEEAREYEEYEEREPWRCIDL